eukprot:1158006-Pelagomonas_calceolata.AAC.27
MPSFSTLPCLPVRRHRNAAAAAKREVDQAAASLSEAHSKYARLEMSIRDLKYESQKQVRLICTEESVVRLRTLLNQARSLLKEAGVTNFMADDPGFPGDTARKPSTPNRAHGGQCCTSLLTSNKLRADRQFASARVLASLDIHWEDEGGALFKATEAREREKEVARLRAEVTAAEHTAQQGSTMFIFPVPSLRVLPASKLEEALLVCVCVAAGQEQSTGTLNQGAEALQVKEHKHTGSESTSTQGQGAQAFWVKEHKHTGCAERLASGEPVATKYLAGRPQFGQKSAWQDVLVPSANEGECNLGWRLGLQLARQQQMATKDQKRMGQQLARQQQEAKDAAAAAATAAADERTRLAQEACCAREAQAKLAVIEQGRSFMRMHVMMEPACTLGSAYICKR